MQTAISRQGRLVYVHKSRNLDVWRLNLVGNQAQLLVRLISSTRAEFDASYSPDRTLH
ncbi:MAG TPA: hypothetical protein VH601_05230 [Bryobacteraceae bacterium]